VPGTTDRWVPAPLGWCPGVGIVHGLHFSSEGSWVCASRSSCVCDNISVAFALLPKFSCAPRPLIQALVLFLLFSAPHPVLGFLSGPYPVGCEGSNQYKEFVSEAAVCGGPGQIVEVAPVEEAPSGWRPDDMLARIQELTQDVTPNDACAQAVSSRPWASPSRRPKKLLDDIFDKDVNIGEATKQ